MEHKPTGQCNQCNMEQLDGLAQTEGFYRTAIENLVNRDHKRRVVAYKGLH